MSHFTVSQKLTQYKFRKKNIASVNIGRGIYVFELVFLFLFLCFLSVPVCSECTLY